VFREAFGMSASEWIRCRGTADSKDREAHRNESQEVRKPRQAAAPAVRILDPVTRNWSWRLTMDSGEARVEVKSIPEMHVAYLRHIGPYAGDSALFGQLFGQLFSWAGPRGLIGADTKVVSIYQDDPGVTDEDRLRVDVAITVPVGTPTDGEIGTRTIPGGTYAVGHFEILPHQYSEIWQTMMGQWLPESGYQCSDGPCLEVYLNEAGEDPESTHIVELYIPVKPL